jgi:hypothetical protein
MNKEFTSQETEKYPRFIDNAPCGEDLFEGKSQETIANIISEMLQNKKNSKIIGIDGGWGSGKSNLVKLIENNLTGKNFQFFVYDAWGHQEDLQRRSILEELTDFLCNDEHKVLDSSKWRKKLKDLLAKTREVEKRTIPILSIGIIVSGLAIILTPLFKAIAENICNPYLKAGFVAIPLLLILCLFLVNLYKEYKIEKKSGEKKKIFKNALTKLFYIYQKAQTEDTTYETISEDEPSVRKFRDWMRAISNDLNEYKLVLVFDNMDRLPKEKVQELWSSIHTFFAEETYDNIHVIVPFDREHIKNAFKTEDGDSSSREIKITQADGGIITLNGVANSEKINCFGDDFINKTFNVVYRVSPPVMSDWKKYFKIKWIDAFGENKIDDDSYSDVIQIYDLLRKYDTPRNIIAFINEFVAIKQLVANTVPDKYIALFILGKNKISVNPIDEIIKPSYMDSLLFIYRDDEELPKYIASLFYQIAPEKAIQVIFTDKLKNALNNNDSELLQKISTIPEFYHILEKAITEIINEENAILALSKIPSESIGNTIQNQHIWDCLYHKVIVRKDQKLVEFQKILLIKTKFQKQYLQRILNEFLSAGIFLATDYYNSVLELEKLFENTNINIYKFLSKKETSVEDFILFVELAKNDYRKFKIYCNNDKLVSYLQGLSEEGLKTIEFIPFIKDDYNLDGYKAHLEGMIISGNKVKGVVDLLYNRYKEIQKPLTEKLTDADIYTLFQNYQETEDFFFDLLSMRISRLNEFNASYSNYFNPALQKVEEPYVLKIAERIEYYMDYDEILLGLKSFNQYPLFVSVAIELTNKSYGDSNLDIISVITNFESICENGGIDGIALIKRLNAWDAKEITSSNIKKIASVSFFDCAIEEECDLTSHCIKCLKEYFNSLSIDQWEVAFKDPNSYEFDLSIMIEDYKYSQNAVDAAKAVLKEIAIGSIPIQDKEIWNNFISKLESQGRKLTSSFNSIRDVFCREDNMTAELFSFFGDWLFKYAEIEKKQESLRTILNSKVVNTRTNLEVILAHKDKMPSIVNIAGINEASDFKDILRSLLEIRKDERFIEFAKSLGVELPKDESKKDEKS